MPVGTGYVPLRDRYCSLLLALNIKSEEYWKGGGDVLHEICETDFNQWSIDEQHQASSYWILGFFAKTKKSNWSSAGQNLKMLLCCQLEVRKAVKDGGTMCVVLSKILTNIWSDAFIRQMENAKREAVAVSSTTVIWIPKKCEVEIHYEETFRAAGALV